MPSVIDPDGERVLVVDPERNSRPFRGWSEYSDSNVGMIGGRTVSYAELYASQTWVAAAVDWFLWKTALVPLKVYRRTGPDGERQRLRPGDHPLADAIANPWDRGSAVALVQHLLGPLLVHGNSLTGIEEGARGKIKFDPADWRRIKPLLADRNDPESEIVGWVEKRTMKADRPLRLDSTLHSAWWSPLGKLGISPLRKLGTTLRIEDAAQQWTQNKLGRGFSPTGVAQLDERFLSLEEPERQVLYDATAKRFRDAYGGFARAGEIPILPPGVTWQDATPTTAVEAQLVDQRRLNREESAAVYQLPPPMIGILDRATYSNITTLRQVAYTDGLAPPLVMIEAGINVIVCIGLLREPDVYVEHDFGGVLRGDKLKEIQTIREAVSTAVMTPNEGRDVQGKPRSKNAAADELYIPANNLKPLGSDANQSDQKPSRRRRRR